MEISNSEIRLMVDELLRNKFFSSKPIIKKVSCPPKRTSPKRTSLKDYHTPPTGPDSDGKYVRYAGEVNDDEKIPGLCKYLDEEYGRIIQFACAIFRKKCEIDFSRIRVILSKELPVNIYHNSDEDVLKMIKNMFEKWENNVSVKAIIDIISNRDKIMHITGEYFSGDRIIVIYYKNFNTTDLEEYKAMISQTLAHEYMHHIHDLICPNFRDIDVILKEAVADFFSVMYSIRSHNRMDRKNDVALDRYNQWNNNFGSSWPYAYALWFLYIGEYGWLPFSDKYKEYEDKGCINKLINVVLASRKGFEEAYEELTN